jgi:hypothetical protein
MLARRATLETKSIALLLSMLELGTRTAVVRVYPSAESTSPGSMPGNGENAGISPLSGSTWTAELCVRQGQLLSCTVFISEAARSLTGNQALHFLEQVGRLSYEVLAEPTPSQPADTTQRPSGPAPPGQRSSGPLPPTPTTWYPVRTYWGNQYIDQHPQTLTREQRRVLSLIDGRRSARDITRLLGIPPAIVDTILRYLRERNFIQ